MFHHGVGRIYIFDIWTFIGTCIFLYIIFVCFYGMKFKYMMNKRDGRSVGGFHINGVWAFPLYNPLSCIVEPFPYNCGVLAFNLPIALGLPFKILIIIPHKLYVTANSYGHICTSKFFSFCKFILFSAGTTPTIMLHLHLILKDYLSSRYVSPLTSH